jgi:hypothetical protein
VLNDLREDALSYIQTGKGDRRLGLLEWSAPNDADPQDVMALAQANPNLGRRGQDAETLLATAKRVVERGGAALTGFRTEKMCIRVRHLDPAIDAIAWRRCLDPGDLGEVRNRVALCLDLSPDGMHATLTAAAVLPDGRVRVEPVRAWSGPLTTKHLRRDLPGELSRVKPMAFGWFPAGPAAALTADLRKRQGWPPRGIAVEGIKGDTAAVCMGLADLAAGTGIAHSGDPLQDAQVAAAERLRVGSTWVFSRRGGGHCDAVYAMAGAAHLARTLPAPAGRPRLIVLD